MEPEREEKIIEAEKEHQHQKTERLWKIIAIILSIFLIIVVIVWAVNSEKVKAVPLIGFIMGIIFLFVSLFWGIGWYRKYREALDGKLLDGKLPPAITIEQAKSLIKEQLQSPEYADYAIGWKQHKIYNIGKSIKSRILVVQLETVYNTAPYQFYIMNMHYPKDMWSYISQEKYNISEITRAVNSLAVSPEEEPDTTVIEEENVLTGNKRKVTETKKREEKKEEKKEEGDFK
jgi:hypothetical protein